MSVLYRALSRAAAAAPRAAAGRRRRVLRVLSQPRWLSGGFALLVGVLVVVLVFRSGDRPVPASAPTLAKSL